MIPGEEFKTWEIATRPLLLKLDELLEQELARDKPGFSKEIYMTISLHLISRIGLLLVSAAPAVLSFGTEGEAAKDKVHVFTILYAGPLSHDQNWSIKSGPLGPDNQKLPMLGGTCSMISSDVKNVPEFSVEHITFEANGPELGVWTMAWTDTVSGTTSDGNKYTWQSKWTYSGPTTDGRAPRPNRAPPSPGDDGYLQFVPSNVNADAPEVNDFFLIQSPSGNVIANSHMMWRFRFQIPPVSMDPPPDMFPFVLLGKYILHTADQLAGELGCDGL